MKKVCLVFAIICGIFSSAPAFTNDLKSDRAATGEKPQSDKTTKAIELVRAAIKAMGGEENLRAIKSVKIEAVGQLNWLEQSERPEGPYLVSYEQTRSFLNLDEKKSSQTIESKNLQTLDWSERAITYIAGNGIAAVKANGRTFPASIAQIKETEMRVALGPERVLLTALDSKDLRFDSDTIMQSVPHHVVKFTWQSVPVTIFLNANTNLPTAVETVSAFPYDHFWTIWGDVPTRTYYSVWTLEAGGARYPYQWDVQRISLPLRNVTILKLAFNPEIPADTFSIPEAVAASFKQRPQPTIDELPLGLAGQPAEEIAAGVVQIRGRWNVTFIKQNDGVVIIEAPISSGYSVKVLDEAKRRFPNLPVKAVISCSDSYPHIGGIREYAARGISIYALDINRPLLERLLAAPHGFYPDALQNKPRKANFKIISTKTVLGAGANRLEIYPIRSETGERMMMIYLPGAKFLYAADLIQRAPDGTFYMPQYLTEIMDAAKRKNLQVEKVFAMHAPPTAWSELESAVSKNMRETGK